MDIPEKSPVLQHASTNNELPKATLIRRAQLRADHQNSLRLCGKVKSIIRFVVIKSLKAVPIIEKHRRAAAAIGGQTVEPAIQPPRKIVLLFVSVDQVGRPHCSNVMPA